MATPVRIELARFALQTRRFSVTFSKYGGRNECRSTYLAFTNVVDIATGQQVADHYWTNDAKRFSRWGVLKQGDVFELEAKVVLYAKGYRGTRADIISTAPPPSIDFTLSSPTHITRIKEGEVGHVGQNVTADSKSNAKAA